MPHIMPEFSTVCGINGCRPWAGEALGGLGEEDF